MTLVFVGDLNLDLRIAPQSGIEMGSDAPGKISVHPGGSAANASAWATRAGGTGIARFIGCIGDDRNGALLRDDLNSAGVHCIIVTRNGKRSRSVAVLLGRDGNRAIISDRDQAIALELADFDESWLDGARWLHVNGYLLLNPRSRELFHFLVGEARRRHIPFSFDPSSKVLLDNAFTPGEVLSAVAGACVVFPSRDEAAFLTGLSDPVEAADHLGRWFDVAVVTCDADGSVLAHQGVVESVPAIPVEVADATGAGDAYVGAFLANYVAGADPQTAAKQATVFASSCVSQRGAR